MTEENLKYTQQEKHLIETIAKIDKEAIKNIKELAQRQCTAYNDNDFVSIDTINSQIRDEIREVEREYDKY